MNLEQFYTRYHHKNRGFNQLIKPNNFTYFYILNFLQEAFLFHFRRPLNLQLQKMKVLDIGCGVGTLALFFGQFAKQVTGIDVSSRAIKIASRARNNLGMDRVKFYQKQLSNLRGNFDLVVCTEVIEHIEDDKQFLIDIRKRLNPNGVLLLTTPSRDNLLYKLGWYKRFDQEVGHLRRYTMSGLLKLLDKQGFRALRAQEVEGPLRNILFTTKLGILIKFIRGPLIPIFHYLDSMSAGLFGAADIQVFAKVKKGQTK